MKLDENDETKWSYVITTQTSELFPINRFDVWNLTKADCLRIVDSLVLSDAAQEKD